MKMKHSPRQGFARPVALLTAGTILVPTILAGCGGGGQQSASIPAPVDRSNSAAPAGVGSTMSNRKPGMSTKQKVVLLAGAAALYYLYKKNQNPAPGKVQYYKSEANGRIYYRDPKTKQAIWVTPPTQPIPVPADQAQEYSRYQGYNNATQGQTYGGYGYEPSGQYQGPAGSVPAPMM